MSLGTDYSPGALAHLRTRDRQGWTPAIVIYDEVPSDSFVAYTRTCAAEIAGNTEWSMGQAYFNILADLRPDIAESISGSVLDCYEYDSQVPAFLEKVKELW